MGNEDFEWQFSALKADLESRGEPLDDPDLQIASTAIEHKLLLITNNTGYFKRVIGLELQNWIRQGM